MKVRNKRPPNLTPILKRSIESEWKVRKQEKMKKIGLTNSLEVPKGMGRQLMFPITANLVQLRTEDHH